jgi:hypothetical protein
VSPVPRLPQWCADHRGRRFDRQTNPAEAHLHRGCLRRGWAHDAASNAVTVKVSHLHPWSRTRSSYDLVMERMLVVSADCPGPLLSRYVDPEFRDA